MPGRRRGQSAADWSRCLRACRAALPPCALGSCLETRSRARELGQLSVGISQPRWVPGLHWGCQELLLGRKGRGAPSGSGDLTPLPPSPRRGCTGRERIPILIPGMPRGIGGPQGLWFPLGKLIPPG